LPFLVAAKGEWKAGLAAGALSIVTCGLALWALRLGDTPILAAVALGAGLLIIG